MGLTHEQVVTMLGPWSVDACDEAEAIAVEAHLDACPACAAEGRRLREAAGWLGADSALAPRPSLRWRVLDGKPARRPLPVGVDAYAAETQRFDDLLSSLAPDEWAVPATPAEGWSAHHLALHLASSDSLLVARFGGPAPIPETDTGFVARTEAVFARHAGGSPEAALAEWRRVRNVLLHSAARARLDDEVDFFGLTLRGASAMTLRAFETWIHADDVRAAVGRPLAAPAADHVRQMADLLARGLLPLVLAAGRETIRLELGGHGGGSWDLSLAESGPPAAVVHADAVEFCRLAADRLSADDMDLVVEGDEELGRALVAAAPSFAAP